MHSSVQDSILSSKKGFLQRHALNIILSSHSVRPSVCLSVTFARLTSTLRPSSTSLPFLSLPFYCKLISSQSTGIFGTFGNSPFLSQSRLCAEFYVFRPITWSDHDLGNTFERSSLGEGFWMQGWSRRRPRRHAENSCSDSVLLSL